MISVEVIAPLVAFNSINFVKHGDATTPQLRVLLRLNTYAFWALTSLIMESACAYKGLVEVVDAKVPLVTFLSKLAMFESPTKNALLDEIAIPPRSSPV